MKNVAIKTEKGKMVITVDLSKDFGPSQSGKTTIIATTSGGVAVDAPDGTVKVNLSVYRSAAKK